MDTTQQLPSRRKPISISPLTAVENTFARGVELIGQTAGILARTVSCILRGEIDWKEVLRQCNFVGVESLPVVGITAAMTGFAMSLQVSREFVIFGGDTAVGGVVAMALVREMGPIAAGVMVAGRVGSAIAAEISTMRVTEQIDALHIMRVDPVQFLVVPRYLAAVFMMPMLSIYAMAVGFGCGMFIANAAAHVPPETFLDSVKQTIVNHDFVVHFVKSFVNAAIVIFFPCAIGLNTRGGAEDVGLATTRSIVWTMTVIFIVNYFITALA